MTSEVATCPGYRFPAEVISHAIWLYYVFSLSLRDVELILAERGITVTRESIRNWCRKFGSEFATRLRRRRPKPGGTWHLDEVLMLSANSCGVIKCCEPRHARLGSWYAIEPSSHRAIEPSSHRAIEPSSHAGYIDCNRRADFL
ncbi:hypothetical protein ACFQX4_27695 [Roseomonas sp. GCM10028921]